MIWIMSLIIQMGLTFYQNKGVGNMPGLHVKFEISPEDFLTHLTDAAYRVALQQGFRGSFLDLKLGIQRALHDLIQREMFVTDLCGLFTICREAAQMDPWSKEAGQYFENHRNEKK